VDFVELTAWGRVLLDEVVDGQATFPAIYGAQAFIFAFTKSCNCAYFLEKNNTAATTTKSISLEFFFHGVIAPSRPEPPYWRGFTITLRNTILGVLGTSDQPVAETSTLTIHKIHKSQASVSPAGFEPAIPQTHAATCVGIYYNIVVRLCVLGCWWTWQCWWRGLLSM